MAGATLCVSGPSFAAGHRAGHCEPTDVRPRCRVHHVAPVGAARPAERPRRCGRAEPRAGFTETSPAMPYARPTAAGDRGNRVCEGSSCGGAIAIPR